MALHDILDSWAATRGPERLADYKATRNAESLDGLPGLVVPARVR